MTSSQSRGETLNYALSQPLQYTENRKEYWLMLSGPDKREIWRYDVRNDEYCYFSQYPTTHRFDPRSRNSPSQAHFILDHNLFLVGWYGTVHHVLNLSTKQWQSKKINSIGRKRYNDSFQSIPGTFSHFSAIHNNGRIRQFVYDQSLQQLNEIQANGFLNCGRGLIYCRKLKLLINGNLESGSKKIQYRSCHLYDGQIQCEWNKKLPKLSLSLRSRHAEHCLVLDTIVVLATWDSSRCNYSASGSQIWCLDLVTRQWFESDVKVKAVGFASRPRIWMVASNDHDVHFVQYHDGYPPLHFKVSVVELIPKELQQNYILRVVPFIASFCKVEEKKKDLEWLPNDIRDTILRFYLGFA